MKFPLQKNVIERIENLNQKAIKKQRESGRAQLSSMWETTKDSMRQVVRSQYKRDFPSGKWEMPLAARRHTIQRMMHYIGDMLDGFHRFSVEHSSKTFKQIYKTSSLRQAYLLDIITPESYRVKLPRNPMFMEASAITTYQGPDADTAWKVRWSAWIDGYKNALESNLRLGALNDSTIEDAQDEIDQTRAGTPAYDMADAFDRIYMSQAVAIAAQAQSDVASVNDDMDIEEIWQTSFSVRVCDICAENEGLTKEEAGDDIPAHPNCECYWRMVPAAWADLLRSGDASDQDLAEWMDANHVVPGSMVVLNSDGDPVAKSIVSYDDWVAGQPLSVISQ